MSVKSEARSSAENKKDGNEIGGLRREEKIEMQCFGTHAQSPCFAFLQMAASSSWGQPSTKTADVYVSFPEGFEKYGLIWFGILKFLQGFYLLKELLIHCSFTA